MVSVASVMSGRLLGANREWSRSLPGGPEIRSIHMICQTLSSRRRMASTAWVSTSSSDPVGSMPFSSAVYGAGSSTLPTTASITASLSGKTRKMVPSAMPAASAISRVVTAAPWSQTSGIAAATMAARRSSGGSGAARDTGGDMVADAS